MDNEVTITIIVNGPRGSGKTRAMNLMLKGLVPDFHQTGQHPLIESCMQEQYTCIFKLRKDK